MFRLDIDDTLFTLSNRSRQLYCIYDFGNINLSLKIASTANDIQTRKGITTVHGMKYKYKNPVNNVN